MQKCLQADPKVKRKDFSQGCVWNTQDADNSPKTTTSAKTENIDLQTQSATGKYNLGEGSTQNLYDSIYTRKCMYATFYLHLLWCISVTNIVI